MFRSFVNEVYNIFKKQTSFSNSGQLSKSNLCLAKWRLNSSGTLSVRFVFDRASRVQSGGIDILNSNECLYLWRKVLKLCSTRKPFWINHKRILCRTLSMCTGFMRWNSILLVSVTKEKMKIIIIKRQGRNMQSTSFLSVLFCFSHMNSHCRAFLEEFENWARVPGMAVLLLKIVCLKV